MREETLLNRAHSHSHGAARPSLSPEDLADLTPSKANKSPGFFGGLDKVKTIAWLLTLGDGMHNFLGIYYIHYSYLFLF